MASNHARAIIQRSSNYAKTLLRRTQSSPVGSPKLNGVGSTLPRHRPFSSSRLPVELVCLESLMPLHSVTACALLKSMLSSEVGRWAFLSEGFATPL